MSRESKDNNLEMEDSSHLENTLDTIEVVAENLCLQIQLVQQNLSRYERPNQFADQISHLWIDVRLVSMAFKRFAQLNCSVTRPGAF